MNNKGQMATIGMLISVAIVVIVGAILMQATAQSAGDVRNTVTLANQSVDIGANATAVNIPGYKRATSVVVWNITANCPIAAANYTITNNVVSNGAEVVTITPHVNNAAYLYDWNISGVFEPTSYGDGAGRAVTGLIVVFFALAIAAIALYPIYQGELKSILAGN